MKENAMKSLFIQTNVPHRIRSSNFDEIVFPSSLGSTQTSHNVKAKFKKNEVD